MFDVKQFLNQTVNAPMATTIIPAPEGEWLAQVSTKVTIEEWFGEAKWNDKSSGKEKTQTTAKIPIEIIDPKAKEKVPRETLMVNYDMFLDFDDQGRLATGEDKNVRLGALREAVGQNVPGWTFPNLFGAGPFMAKVVHTKDEKRPDETFAKISRVAKLK